MILNQIPDSHLDGLKLWNKTGSKPVEEAYSAGKGLNNTDYVLHVQSRSTVTCGVYQVMYWTIPIGRWDFSDNS